MEKNGERRRCNLAIGNWAHMLHTRKQDLQICKKYPSTIHGVMALITSVVQSTSPPRADHRSTTKVETLAQQNHEIDLQRSILIKSLDAETWIYTNTTRCNHELDI